MPPHFSKQSHHRDLRKLACGAHLLDCLLPPGQTHTHVAYELVAAGVYAVRAHQRPTFHSLLHPTRKPSEKALFAYRELSAQLTAAALLCSKWCHPCMGAAILVQVLYVCVYTPIAWQSVQVHGRRQQFRKMMDDGWMMRLDNVESRWGPMFVPAGRWVWRPIIDHLSTGEIPFVHTAVCSSYKCMYVLLYILLTVPQ